RIRRRLTICLIVRTRSPGQPPRPHALSVRAPNVRGAPGAADAGCGTPAPVPAARGADTLVARGLVGPLLPRTDGPTLRPQRGPAVPPRQRPREPSLAMPPKTMTTKHLFVTGGVASSLGKGLTASSLGALLKARGLRVTMQKLDPYLNVDPGTMNPFQHGE